MRYLRHDDPARDMPIAPGLSIEGYRECDVLKDWLPGEVRKGAPYKPGMVVWVNAGSDRYPEIKLALVHRVFAKLSARETHFYPKYRMRFATKKGRWSNMWHYVCPGDIFRAYHDKDDRARDPAALACKEYAQYA